MASYRLARNRRAISPKQPVPIMSPVARSARSGNVQEPSHEEDFCAYWRGRCRARSVGCLGQCPVADRHQVQPCRRQRHAERQGRAQVQGTRREIHQRQGEGRGLSELAIVQGQGRNGRVAARFGADAGALDRQIRPARRQGIRGARSALAVQGRRHLRQGHEGPGRQISVQEARSRRASPVWPIGTTASTWSRPTGRC